ncbi:hypothetical protein ACFSE0_13800 [Ochrobactrum teleogrylli]|uniref:hypothetical protein n=1 Tax=Ochrobactrum teleogrylli TaxID=2479765 RepID=UPI001F214632|nr:hypothetical protein [[Ochrobactrum] teleogrylli]
METQRDYYFTSKCEPDLVFMVFSGHWPTWDSELEWVILHGPFVEGTKGTMKPRQGPKVTFELVKVVPNESFVDRARLPLTTLDFGHYYFPSDNAGSEAMITHTVEFRGFLAPLFGRLIGRNIKLHLRSAMEKLAEQAFTTSSS